MTLRSVDRVRDHRDEGGRVGSMSGEGCVLSEEGIGNSLVSRMCNVLGVIACVFTGSQFLVGPSGSGRSHYDVLQSSV